MPAILDFSAKFSILIIMFVVMYQDVKARQVSFILFPILFLLTICVTNIVKPFEMVVSDMLMIMGFITIQLAAIVLYLLLKFRKLLNPFRGYLGTGDLLFWFAIAPLFSFVNFLLFFVVSLLFSAIVFVSFKRLFVPKSTIRAKLIPLAGMQAAFLLLLLLFNRLFWQMKFHQDHVISIF